MKVKTINLKDQTLLLVLLFLQFSQKYKNTQNTIWSTTAFVPK